MMRFLLGWQGYAAVCVVAAAVGFGGGWKARDLIADAAQGQAERAQVAAVQQALKRTEAANAITADIGGKSAARQVEIRTITRDIIREVPVYVTAEADRSCPVPVGFVRLHDAAAAGGFSTAVPVAAGPPNDAPSGVALSAVAETVADNYGACRADAERLTALQHWIEAQAAAWVK